jgi:HK97 family phage portal protein
VEVDRLMKILGLNITRTTKAAPPVPVAENRGGWFRVLESYAGAWQQNVTVDYNTVLSSPAIYACMTLIAGDFAKLRIKLVEQKKGIWSEVEGNSPFLPVLRKPNKMQTRIQFLENWILSKLMRGNTYVLKVRDQRGIVTALYILDPNRVKTMVSDDGSVFYQLSSDNVTGIQNDVQVPSSEIIHDRFNCLFHPLIGTSPIFAAGVAATQGINIQNNSAAFFGNKSQPGGILTAPGAISTETALRLKADWQSNYTGENAGKIAVMGDGLTFQSLGMLSASDSQLVEQLKWTAETVCSVFHVPPYKIGVGAMPTNNNIQALNVEYYSQCLQALIEAAELCLDEGLGLDRVEGKMLGTEFDLDGLLRMDSVTQMDVLEKASGVMTIDEKRKKLDLRAVTGGASVYLQQQNYSLEALAKRDAGPDPFGTAKAPAPPPPEPDPKMLVALYEKELREAIHVRH